MTCRECGKAFELRRPLRAGEFCPRACEPCRKLARARLVTLAGHVERIGERLAFIRSGNVESLYHVDDGAVLRVGQRVRFEADPNDRGDRLTGRCPIARNVEVL